MPYYLISERGNRVARFTDKRIAKVHQMRAFIRGVDYSIEEVRCEGACSYPQCYVPCGNCAEHIKPVEVQLDEQIHNRITCTDA